ncbi:hypothetical protein BVRB_2g037810 [Beta vulgaris subsp. vulgaris]|uniref:uncharacterized protein LOC104887029 isoform X2 n=1 Tax=Beta vulgaris subsp. vulgaris TaxID=3555 RepID=UPI0005402270|nr:uncharacterized protein LOC104887029 isoform X2 [Beta vulgaris subsp. vulgaris]KMT17499.1 hypothetical protein BVRB_2g037810 [Beta vulgaris subsp. vulgaris]
MSSSYNSPSRSPGSGGGGGGGSSTTMTTAAARLQLGAISRLRSSSMKKPPEPLRRAVADSLSSSSSSSSFSSISALSSHHPSTSPSIHASEASRTLRDYLAAPSTTDLAYCVILEHTLAERDRSPAVVARCVALLKRHLLRYKPSEDSLLQIDRFCVHIIAECDIGLSRKLLPWSHSLNQQSSAAKAPVNGAPLPVSSFASASLIKSLNYVRSLVAQHIPRRSFQPAAFAGAPSAPRQILPSLSSLLSRSFNSQLSPANNGDSSVRVDTTLSVPSQRKNESFDGIKDLEYITADVLKWRWRSDQDSAATLIDGDQYSNTQDLTRSNLLDVGAAALLVADLDAKKGQPWRHFGTADMPYLDQLLQPSSMSSVTNSASARQHLRIITASKRTKSGSQQIWEDCSVSTFRPRARPLFQYRHYSEQQPLKLNPTEVGEVISAVCSETSMPNANLMTISTGLSNHRTKPSIDVAVSVLIKLVIDMYILDSESAAPLTLSMLEDMVCSPKLSSRTRSFDLILNLAVHAHLLDPVVPDGVSTIDEDYSQELSLDSEAQMGIQSKITDSQKNTGDSSAIDNFESWILNILYEILLLLVQIEEKQESVWASALSCLLYFVCDGGRIRRSRLKGLDIRVIKALIEVSRISSWAEVVHSKLISILASMFYDLPDEQDITTPSIPKFLPKQVDMIGGIDFIFIEYSLARTREEKRNLYSLLFDYVLHHINVTNIATGVPEYATDEIQPLATLLSLANAPEAFHISVKLGVDSIGEILRRSVSSALFRYSDSEQLNTILKKVMSEFDSIISSFTHLQKEFSDMRQLTKSCKFLKSIEDGVIGRNISKKAKLSWATLHSLLHSDRIACRQNGYIWLGDLLISEISDERDGDLYANISSLQQQITLVDLKDSSALSDIPLSIWLMCGLLKSKDSTIRAGFLFVSEVLLMRCKCLLDEYGLEDSAGSSGDRNQDRCLEKANSVIDIMSSCLSLVAQINETDHFNILKMCDILFSQLCLKVPPASADKGHLGRASSTIDINNKVNPGECVPLHDSIQQRGHEDVDNFYSSLVCETSSMAALLLQGSVVVPLQLVARVPAVLFYWPLIQLAGAATDNIALGVSVGSKGRGNLPGATSDIRAALLLLLIAKCTADSDAFQEVDGEDFFRQLLDDTDSRVAYYSSAFLLKRMMTADFDNYQRRLQQLVFRAQQSNNEKLLENPYLQMRGILQLSNDFGSGL